MRFWFWATNRCFLQFISNFVIWTGFDEKTIQYTTGFQVPQTFLSRFAGNFDVISKACLASGFGHCGSWTRDRLGLMQESSSWRGFPHIQDDSWWYDSLSLGSHKFRSTSQWRSRMLEVLRRFGEMDEQGNLRRLKSSDCCLNCWTEMRDPKAVVDLYWN